VAKSVFTGRYRRLRELLAAAREEAGLTQAALAVKLSRPQSYVSKYERGERRLDIIEFLDVTKAIGVPPARILRQLESPTR
jgi:transcriptional regulator with XRE-family HTH domain